MTPPPSCLFDHLCPVPPVMGPFVVSTCKYNGAYRMTTAMVKCSCGYSCCPPQRPPCFNCSPPAHFRLPVFTPNLSPSAVTPLGRASRTNDMRVQAPEAVLLPALSLLPTPLTNSFPLFQGSLHCWFLGPLPRPSTHRPLCFRWRTFFVIWLV